MARPVMLFVLAAVSATGSWAGIITQTVDLQPGWNAVFLEVVPEDADAETVFNSATFSVSPVERAAMWTGEPDTAQFITDPEQLIPETPGWLQYRDGAAMDENTLNRLLPGRAYVIKLGGSAPVAWSISGNTGPKAIRWLPDTFTLTGLPVNPSTAPAPTFERFFAGSPAHAGQRVLRMVNNQWTEVADLSTQTINRGEAYWIFTEGTSEYQGPLNVRLEAGGVLDFGTTATDLTLSVLADTANEDPPRDLMVDLQVTQVTGQPITIPLEYRVSNFTDGTFSWPSLINKQTFELPALSDRILAIQADRGALPSEDPVGTRYVSMLRIEDPDVRYDIPVFISKGADSRVGLWVGYAVLNRVTEHITELTEGTNPEDPPVTLVKPRSEPTAVGREFSFRLLIHVDATGKARLLQKALLAYPEPADPVVLASDAAIASYTAALNPDEEQTGLRMSSPAFSFDGPLAGEAGKDTFPVSGATGPLEFVVNLPFDDPLNPFVHLYHPDHDNLTVDEEPIGEGTANSESWSVERTVELTFANEDPEGRNPAGWGTAEAGGTYKETVKGLMREERSVSDAPGSPSSPMSNSIITTGYFRLTRVSTTGTLDP